jgi:hypothetical protein
MDNYNGNGQTMTVIDSKTVLQALALINDCNKYKMDLAINRVLLLLMLSSLFRQTRRN